MILELTIDHLGYLTRRAHRRATHAGLRRVLRRGPGLLYLRVLHEADDSCCAVESWGTTAGRIQRALAEDGEPVAWLNLGRAEAATA